MKKVFTITLVFVMLFALCSCGKSTNNQGNDQETPAINEADSIQASVDTASSDEMKGKGDEISIEDIYCSEDGGTYLNYELKVRNNLDVSVDGIRVQCKLIDAAGDSLESFEWLFTDIESGRAEYVQH